MYPAPAENSKTRFMQIDLSCGSPQERREEKKKSRVCEIFPSFEAWLLVTPEFVHCSPCGLAAPPLCVLYIYLGINFTAYGRITNRGHSRRSCSSEDWDLRCCVLSSLTFWFMLRQLIRIKGLSCVVFFWDIAYGFGQDKPTSGDKVIHYVWGY